MAPSVISRIKIALLLGSLLLSAPAKAGPELNHKDFKLETCEGLFRSQVQAPSLSRPIQEWLDWEVSPSITGWEQARPTSQAPIAFVDGASVAVETLNADDIKGLERFLNTKSHAFPWLKHPYNTDARVPNFMAASNVSIPAHHTASRTVVMDLDGRLVSVKMPTNHPFGLTKNRQPEKTNMDADLKYSVARSRAIEQIDHEIGLDPHVIVQKEIAAVMDKKTGNGYLFRDLSPLQDGHRYLPGHQLPYIGKQIAEKHGKAFAPYWAKHWAAEIGRYQAKLLYRYGLEVRAINPQNFLIQLDAQSHPTGVIVWRDLAESHLVQPIASRIGLQDFVERDLHHGGWGVHQHVLVDERNLYWLFNDKTPTLSRDDKTTWEQAHDDAFREELTKALGIHIPGDVDLRQFLNRELKNGNESDLIQRIVRWHQSLLPH